MLRFAVLMSLLLLLTGCAVGATAPTLELVLQENTLLTATTPSGRISIRAEKKFDRSYSWGQCTLRSDMQARPKRWFGSLVPCQIDIDGFGAV
jgi:hypothetical protein